MRLVATVNIDVEEFPLHLPPPDEISSGGFVVPYVDPVTGKVRTLPAYSNIDLLIAGLEAVRKGVIVYSLTNFFDVNRVMMSDHDVVITISSDAVINTWSIAQIKSHILINKDGEMLRIMMKNAPLTFKWVRI